MLNAFGNAPAHILLHALFRNAHVVPNNADKFMQNRLLAQMFNFKQQLAEEKYFIAFSTYAILWLGGVFRFSSDLLQQQVRTVFQEPEALITVVALGIVVLTPVAYAMWLASRNVWKVAAPKISSAESSVKAAARESWKPDTERLGEFLETIVLFSELPRETMNKIAEAMSYIPVKKDTLIIRDDMVICSLRSIRRGRNPKDDEAGVAQSVANWTGRCSAKLPCWTAATDQFGVLATSWPAGEQADFDIVVGKLKRRRCSNSSRCPLRAIRCSAMTPGAHQDRERIHLRRLRGRRHRHRRQDQRVLLSGLRRQFAVKNETKQVATWDRAGSAARSVSCGARQMRMWRPSRALSSTRVSSIS